MMAKELNMQVGAEMWCVLRTSPGRTLALAKSLREAELDAWTPAQVISRRRPRSKVRTEIEAPITPTFVFARADALPELVRCLSLHINPHPPFSIFRHAGRVPLIADGDIESLRAAEQRERRRMLRTQRRTFQPGDRVALTEGAFAGMSGVVKEGDGKFALVSFGGHVRVKIATFLLVADGIEQTTSNPGDYPEPAASAAR